MQRQFSLGDIIVDVEFKDIKNVHLSVHPPAGRVSVAAPERMSLENIRLFAIAKLDWIKRQRKSLATQLRETSREYLNQESHFQWGKRYLLRVLEDESTSRVEVQHSRLVLSIQPQATIEDRRALVARWYRSLLKTEAAQMVAKWAPVAGVATDKIYVQSMKTRWGSCNSKAGSIRLNTELAKKPKECVEYVVVHELMHLLEPTHNARFTRMMNRVMPNWRLLRDQLNDLPIAYDGLRC